MEIIVSHNHLDFDGLACMVAAQRLYPRAELVFVGGMSGNVQRFMSLHKDSLIIRRLKEINLSEVELVVVVDTNSPRRLGDLASWIRQSEVEIHLYDHHSEPLEPLNAQVKVTDTLGAATTLLVEKIQQMGQKMTRFEATVLALGIYEDTGSLTFTTTTARDVRAVAYLLEQGANLSVVANFIELSFTDQQKELFNRLLSSVRHKNINGIDVVIASARDRETVGNLDFITHKLGDVETLDALFTVVEMSKRVYIVARSRTDSLDVCEVCKVFGGGGHPRASSAAIKGRSLESVLEELDWVLDEKTQPPLVARDIMSTPVKSISMHLSLKEADKIMLRYGHTGLPVLEEGKVVGVISRRDVDKARLHGLEHSPVKGYMARQVVSVLPDTPLSELQYQMVTHDIGRLPVIDNDELIGIVSRSDILRTFHGQDYPEDHKLLYDVGPAASEPGYWFSKNWREKMHRELPGAVMQLLETAGKIADDLGMSVYVIGGFVRDLWLGYPNMDIDLVVEGNAPVFAQHFAEFLGGEVRVHDRFGTAIVIFPGGGRVDIATARVEYYEYPAALPSVERSSLRQDLYRRDFTINAMAIQLNSRHFGGLVDFFGGRLDLERGLVRVLYNLSFVEDPTRIIRAIRFEQRFGFRIELQTLQFLEDAVYRGFLRAVSTSRIKEELKTLLSETNPLPGLRRLADLGVAAQVLPEAEFNAKAWKRLSRVQLAQELVRNSLLDAGLKSKTEFESKSAWLGYWLVLFHEVGLARAVDISVRYHLNRLETQVMSIAYRAEAEILRQAQSPKEVRMSTLFNLLSPCPEEALVYLLSIHGSKAWQEKILACIKLRSQPPTEIGGRDLINLGLKPGPIFREILDELRDARLDGLVASRDDELAWLKKYLPRREEVRK